MARQVKDFKSVEEFDRYIETVAEISRFFVLDYKYVREMDDAELHALAKIMTRFISAQQAQGSVAPTEEGIELKAEESSEGKPINKEDYLE